MASRARTEAACNTSAIDDLFTAIWASRNEYRPRLPHNATATSAFNGQPPAGTSSDGEADHKPLRMAGNGGLVSRPVDVTDEQAFPGIAEAIRHAVKLREARND